MFEGHLLDRASRPRARVQLGLAHCGPRAAQIFVGQFRASNTSTAWRLTGNPKPSFGRLKKKRGEFVYAALSRTAGAAANDVA